jgi:dihydrolipoamide dehydrogenase
MIIVGSGAIGVEFALYNAMGTEVTVVEFMPNIIEDEDISKQMERSMKKAGVKNYDQLFC